jgi:hypothetical protein
MRTQQALFVAGLAACLAAGCKSSDRTVETAGKTVESRAMVALTTEGIPLAGSPDGRFFAEARGLDQNEGEILIRAFDGGVTQRVVPATNDGPVPLLFSRDGNRLIALRGEKDPQMVSIDVESGAEKPIGKWAGGTDNTDMFPGVRNADHTIVASDRAKENVIVTAAGTSLRTPGKVQFDPYGNAWFKSGDGWSKVDKDGRLSAGANPPKGLVPDQTRLRGSLRLVEEKQEVKHKGATAYLSTIWLELTNGDKTDAGLVGFAPDLWAFGFVPGRDAVYLVTNNGSYLVPLEVKPAPRP